MKNWKFFLGGAGLLAATTVGAGIFALPYLFEKAGWLTGIFYLAVLSAILIIVHYLYWQTLARLKEKGRLLGLTREYLGRNIFYPGFFIIVGGLILILVVYLILIGQFLRLIFPAISFEEGVLIFWLFASLPLVLKLRRLVGLEFLGAALMAAIIIFVFGAGRHGIEFNNIPVFNPRNFFLPFGAILFSLAGWTAIEPIFDWTKRTGNRAPSGSLVLLILASGTLASALLYFLFVTGIFGSAREITPDTLSGLTNWPLWKIEILAWLGIIGVWTSYVPISLEVKNSLEKDLALPAGAGLFIVLFSPLVLIGLGLREFLSVIGLAGGVFLGLQYLLIVLVGKKVLDLSRSKKFLLNIIGAIFVLAAVYEIYYSLLQ